MSAISPRQSLARPGIKGQPTRPTPEVAGAGTRQNKSNGRYIALRKFSIYCTFTLSIVLLPRAEAAFVGPYSLASFTLANHDSVGGLSGTDGSAVSPNGGLSVILTGGNSGSGLGGITDLIIIAPVSGLIQFQYSYSSLDSPGNDSAGYLLGSNFFQLTDADGVCNNAACPGTVEFRVSLGEAFGFRVETVDNQGEPGILTISNFSPPSSTTDTPEPRTGPVILVLLVSAATLRLWTRKPTNRGNA
jgi:hypothetical protein